MLTQEIRRRLLVRAGALGLQGDSEERQLDALLDREVRVPPPTDDDCRRWFEAHRDQFRSGDLVEADHILFAVTGSVPLSALRERAQQALERILADPAHFGDAARELSNCPSARVDGNLGQLSRGDVVPEFWQALASFAGTGVIPRLVESRFGLHIVRVTRRVDGRALPFEMVRERIAAGLAEASLQRALRDYAHALLHETSDDLH